MDDSNILNGSWPDSRTILYVMVGVAGNPHLAAGLLIGLSMLGLIIFIAVSGSQHSKFQLLMRSWRASQCGVITGVRNVHVSFYSVFLMDIMNAILAVVLGIMFTTSTCTANACNYVYLFWLITKSFMVFFHLFTALVAIIFMCHPQIGKKVYYASTALPLLFGLSIPLYIFVYPVAIYVMAAAIFGLALAIIVKSAMSTVSPSVAASKIPFVLTAMTTLMITYLPTFVVECLIISQHDKGDSSKSVLDVIYVNILCFTNIGLIMDALLLIFVLKLPVVEDEQQQSMEPPSYVFSVGYHNSNNPGNSNNSNNFNNFNNSNKYNNFNKYSNYDKSNNYSNSNNFNNPDNSDNSKNQNSYYN